MSTITAKILSKLNNSEFNVGMLSSNNEDRAALIKVKPEDVDTLIDNLQQLKTYVLDLQESKQANARKLLESLVNESTDFSSVDELLSVLGGNVATVAATGSTTPKLNGNKSFDVTLFDKDKDEHRTYTITNKVIKKSLREDPVYQEIIAKDKTMENVEVFLRAYSPQYAEAYPINAKWKKHTFHMNSKGRLNEQSAMFFEEYKAEHPEADEKEFKQFVSESYKKV
ncbi:hypothetical protein QMT25_01145 [Cronobacter dublinensis]|uniref:hypothetical protein n=1 Tax=Cronobacter dublinensis TaxID=413497 RepID=UPI0024C33C1A|nr:hypothetical protein [Cronobacter dublinensis]MDK1195562.1 hypothetical protein [Cronobacter dublinensis]